MKTYNYTIVLEPADEGGYTVTVPSLPAIVTEGDTYEEAVDMAIEAIGLYLRALAEEGREIPVEASPSTSVAVKVEVPLSTGS